MNPSLFTVEGSMPPAPERNWRQNRSFDVLTTDIQSAITLVVGLNPGITIHAVNRRSREMVTVLLDPRIKLEA